MRRTVPLVLAALLAALTVLASGCAAYTGTSLVPAGKPAVAETLPVEQLVGAINGFGVDLLAATIGSEGSGGNLVVSPASVHAALSMTANGAAGKTDAQMREVLGLGAMTADDANKQWASLLGALADRSAMQQLDVANALWARQGVPLKKPFLDADRNYFGAELATLDFAKQDAAGAINNWVSKNTKGMIPSIIDKVPAEAILYLTNAVYFNGDWESPFKAESTAKEPFTRADGSKVDVDMMNATELMPIAKTATLLATKLDYAGGDSAFCVFLPEPGVTLVAAMRDLQGGGLASLVAALQANETTDVALGLPKLDSDLSVDLATQLEQMGMPLAFDQGKADFSGMADAGSGNIFINRVLHKTKIKVDEKGTEAAAATAVEMGLTAAIEAPQPVRFTCDRPYLFAIVDQKSGAVLFLGAVGDPTK